MLLRARKHTDPHRGVITRPKPSGMSPRRAALTAAASLAALVAVGGAACSSSVAPPAASSEAGGPSGTAASGTASTAEAAAAALATMAGTIPTGATASPTTTVPSPSGEDPEVAAAPDEDDTRGQVFAFDRDGRLLATAPFGADGFGAPWRCTYLAVGAASGSTLELRIDELRGNVTPAAGDVVALTCQHQGRLVHQEIITFDPDHPLAGVDAMAAARASDPRNG